ncbi:DUF11 domain-containing protein [Leptolyngbya iicbica]|uniref:DUF11 domain-containing protein n=2 Tax=Cyanophyceae TaxID=3028117 RepID=A0A4Q7E450_9CYAN|nr:DUF11 domain-containing protein [Leptolyngbya sp. LK]RZM76691.1 DUF11 domain-containing protein [Leptolyngbya sp. LK]
MLRLDWIFSILGSAYRLVGFLARPLKRRFWLQAAIAFIVVQLLNWSGSVPGVGFEPVNAQVGANGCPSGVICNRAGGSYVDANNNTVRVSSNRTDLQAAIAVPLTIIKTADRGAAEPGDVVVYRLLVRNPGTAPAGPLTITDELPLGMQFIEESVRTSPLQFTSITTRDRSFTLDFGGASLGGGQELSVVYAALVTPDAIRGSGRNVAQALTPSSSASATNELAIRPGILADCGTLVGRVFVDKNFDGEQQPGEPGVPNAVVFMDDGNRILTDADGLFSVANVLAGNRVGTLDLTSLPGYTLAPNLFRLADNSQSRLVQLEPGGLARMNFGVTPAFGEEQG